MRLLSQAINVVAAVSNVATQFALSMRQFTMMLLYDSLYP